MKPAQLIVIVLILLNIQTAGARDYYFHPTKGNDQNDGTSRTKAFRSLAKVSQLSLVAGDRILLAAGETFFGSLQLKNVRGTSPLPITVESVSWNESGTASMALIDVKGLREGILIEDCSYLTIRSISITGNGYSEKDSTSGMRTGVMIRTDNKAMKGITLDGIVVRDVFYENPGYTRAKGEVATANGTERYGWGIRLVNSLDESMMEHIVIRNCTIENVSHTGIKLTGKGRNIQHVRIFNNKVLRTGGPGIQMSNVRFIYVAENTVQYSGSVDDTRKWGRGSGLWTWSASNVIIERNTFMHANGPGDSAGAHIDYNCDNIILQYNFSAHNAGGFCEILGNNYNCAYRYNISVNDGHRVKGQDGAFQEGKTFWLSGYQGNKERKGPVNTYFYNNTIYVSEKILSKIAIDNRSEGVLIANNIFFIPGESTMVKGDQYKPDDDGRSPVARVFFKHNLFLKSGSWPSEALITDAAPRYGDPGFKKPGGLSPEDYIPTNKTIGRGIEIPFLPGDDFGLIHGLVLKMDILGNPITGAPGFGAIAY